MYECKQLNDISAILFTRMIHFHRLSIKNLDVERRVNQKQVSVGIMSAVNAELVESRGFHTWIWPTVGLTQKAIRYNLHILYIWRCISDESCRHTAVQHTNQSTSCCPALFHFEVFSDSSAATFIYSGTKHRFLYTYHHLFLLAMDRDE